MTDGLHDLDTEPCGLRGLCGGCFYSGISYEEELYLKDQRVRSLILPLTDEESIYEGMMPSPETSRYRGKMEYSFGDSFKGGPLTLGLHRRRSFYDICDASSCELVHGDFNAVVRETAAYMRERGISYFHKRSHEGYLRHLLVRRAHATGEMLIDLVTSSQMDEAGEEELLDGFRERILSLERDGTLTGHIASLLHTVNDSPSDAIKDAGTGVLHGRDFIVEELLGLRFHVSAFSFFQTNTPAAALLYSLVRKYALMAGHGYPLIYDLYSGTGTIAQVLSPVGGRVVGVEIAEEAVEGARASAALNSLSNVEFIAGDVLRVLDSLPRPDLIVLDPPREGVRPRALHKIISYAAPYIIYVSCRPESLARDLIELRASGYRIKRFGAIDQFPRADHVETVVLMSRVSSESRARLLLQKYR